MLLHIASHGDRQKQPCCVSLLSLCSIPFVFLSPSFSYLCDCLSSYNLFCRCFLKLKTKLACIIAFVHPSFAEMLFLPARYPRDIHPFCEMWTSQKTPMHGAMFFIRVFSSPDILARCSHENGMRCVVFHSNHLYLRIAARHNRLRQANAAIPTSGWPDIRIVFKSAFYANRNPNGSCCDESKPTSPWPPTLWHYVSVSARG